jgi:hypothetical protein
MVASVLLALSFALGQTPTQSTLPPAPVGQKAAAVIEADLAKTLLSAKRIYVESFGNDSINKILQAMVIDAIGSNKRFIITENKDKADLVLKGSSLEKTSHEMHSLGSATTVSGASGGGHSQISGQANAAGATISGTSSGGFTAREMGIADSEASIETVNDARASVPLISKDGDMVWSTTQESKGPSTKVQSPMWPTRL